jgi:hypothetical protein
MSELRHLQAQHAALLKVRKIIDNGTHMAAGIKVEITIGGYADKAPDLVFDVGDGGGILTACAAAIKDSLDIRVRLIRTEINQLQTWLDKHAPQP